MASETQELEPRLVLAATDVSGFITANDTWDNPDGYRLVGDVTVRDGATLTILSGVRVTTTSFSNELFIGNGVSNGNLDANGAIFDAELILREDAGGTITGNTFEMAPTAHPEHVPLLENNNFQQDSTIFISGGVIETNTTWNVGSGVSTYSLQSDVFVQDGADLTIADGVQVIRNVSSNDLFIANDGSGAGLFANDVNFSIFVDFGATATGTVTNSNFITTPNFDGDSTSQLTVTGNEFLGSVNAHPEFVPKLQGNTFGSQNTISLFFSTIDIDLTLPVFSTINTYRLLDDVFVQNAADLTIADGVQITRAGSNDDLFIANDGSTAGLIANDVTFSVFVDFNATAIGTVTNSTFVTTPNFDGDSTSLLTVTGNEFLGSVNVHPEFVPKLLGNTFGTQNTISLFFSTIDVDLTLPVFSTINTYRLLDDVFVQNAADLTIADGVQITRAGSNADLHIALDGSGAGLFANDVNFSVFVDFNATAIGTVTNSTFVTTPNFDGDSTSLLTVTGNEFLGSVNVHPEFVPKLLGNTFGTQNTISLFFSTIDVDLTLPVFSTINTYRLLDDVFVQNAADLTIADGVQITRAGSNADLQIALDGSGAGLFANDVNFSVFVDFNATAIGTVTNSTFITTPNFDGDSTSLLMVTGNEFLGSVNVHPEFVPKLLGNTFGTQNTISLFFSTIDVDLTLPVFSTINTYRLLNDVFVQNAADLTIADGVQITQIGSNDDLFIANDGSTAGLIANDVTFSVFVDFSATATGIVTNSNFVDSTFFRGDSSSLLVVTGNDFQFSTDVHAEFLPKIANNSFGGNTTIDIFGSVIDTDITWEKFSTIEVLRLTGDVSVTGGADLTIADGLLISDSGSTIELFVAADGTNAGIVANGVTFSTELQVFGNAVGSLTRNVFLAPLSIGGNGTPNHSVTFQLNDFSLISPAVFGMRFTGGQIDLRENEWGTLIAAEIEDKVFHQIDDANRPLILFDPPANGIRVAVAPAEVAEDSNDILTYTFTRVGDVSSSLTVDFFVQGSAIFNSDYTQTGADTFDGMTGAITFPANQSQVSLTIDPTADGMVESNETVEIVLLDGDDYVVDPTPAVGTITDDDLTTLTLASVNSNRSEGSGGGTIAFTFSVTLNNAVTGGFDVAYATNDGTATVADEDYIDNDGVLTFVGNAGEVKTITVLVNQDTKVEADEIFQVVLGAISNLGPGVDPGNLTVSGTPQTGTIQNDDTAALTLTGVNATQLEGTGGGTKAFTFSVTLDTDVEGGFDVAYFTNDGTATLADGDYGDNDGNLSFNGMAGETSTITVLVNQDSKVEANEVFQVALGTVTNLANGISAGDILTIGGSQLGTIQNDDAANLTLTSINADQPEGNGSGTTAYTFSVTLDNIVQGGFDVAYETNDGTATTGDMDYMDNDGVLNFVGDAGEMKTITVVVNHDDKTEGDETFQVALGAISNLIGVSPGAIVIDGSPQTATIRNDDTAILNFTSVNATRTEGDGNGTTAFVFAVTLNSFVSGGFDLPYSTNDGTATTLDGDYVDNDGVLSFTGTPGEVHMITVLANQDGKLESDETFQVVLGAITNAGNGVDPASLTISGNPQVGTILNDDTANVRLVGTTAIVQEGTSSGPAELVFSVVLDDEVEGGFDLAYTTNDGTATLADTDYVDNDGSLSFAGTAGETQTIRVVVNPDAKVEGNELLNVVLGSVTNLSVGLDAADIIRAGSPQVGTIQNDDVATLTLAEVNADQLEGTGVATTSFTFSVTLDNAVEGGFNISYRTDDGTATVADADYVDNDASLFFGGTAGESRLITIEVNQDGRVEDDETFQVALGTVSNLLNGISANDIQVSGVPATGTIQNDDIAELTLSPLSATRSEGTNGVTTEFTFNVTLSDTVDGGFDVSYTTNDGSATLSDGDYIDNDGVLSFNGTMGETQTITVVVNHDSKLEADETFQVILGTITNTGGGNAQDINVNRTPVIGTILNDDTATLSLSNITTTTLAEGTGTGTTDFTFEVTLDNAVQGGFNLDFVTNNGPASGGGASTSSNDFVGSRNGSFAFQGLANELFDFTIRIAEDNRVEADELFHIAVQAIRDLAPGIDPADLFVLGSPISGTITNDDTAAVSITPALDSQLEGAGGDQTEFEFTITLDNPVQGGFNLPFTVNDGSGVDPNAVAAIFGVDYVLSTSDTNNNGLLSFSGTALESRTVRVLANDDFLVEADEFFNVLLGSISNVGTGLDTNDIVVQSAPADGVILNDDSTAISLVFRRFFIRDGARFAEFEVENTNAVQGQFNLDVTTSLDNSSPLGNVSLAEPILSQNLGAGFATSATSVEFNGSAQQNQVIEIPVPLLAPTPNLFIDLLNIDTLGSGVQIQDIVIPDTAFLTLRSGEILLAASGEGVAGEIKIVDVDATSSTLLGTVIPFPAFTGGVRVTTGDVNGDQVPDIITGPGPGGGPNIKIFDGFRTGIAVADFFAFQGTPLQGFTGGVYLAAADFNGDGVVEIIVGAGEFGGSLVEVYDISGATPVRIQQFEAYGDSGFNGGVRVAAGNLTGDGTPEIITAPAIAGGPIVRIFDVNTGGMLRQFAAYGLDFLSGLFVTTGDTDGNGILEIITSPNVGSGPIVRSFDATTIFAIQDVPFRLQIAAYNGSFSNGVRTAVVDVDRNGIPEILTVPGPLVVPGSSAETVVRTFLGADGTHVANNDFLAFDGFTGGVFLAAGIPTGTATSSVQSSVALAAAGTVLTDEPVTAELGELSEEVPTQESEPETPPEIGFDSFLTPGISSLVEDEEAESNSLRRMTTEKRDSVVSSPGKLRAEPAPQDVELVLPPIDPSESEPFDLLDDLFRGFPIHALEESLSET